MMQDKKRDDELHAMRINKLKTEMAEHTRLGIKARFMHLSGLSPVSRPSHVARHGELFTGEEMLEWWSKSDNSRDCRCSCTAVLVDSAGNPLTPKLIDRAKAARHSYKPQPEA